jgi:hypothetical protein
LIICAGGEPLEEEPLEEEPVRKCVYYFLRRIPYLEEHVVVLVVEGGVAAEQDVGDHSDAPHIHLWYSTMHMVLAW